MEDTLYTIRSTETSRAETTAFSQYGTSRVAHIRSSTRQNGARPAQPNQSTAGQELTRTTGQDITRPTGQDTTSPQQSVTFVDPSETVQHRRRNPRRPSADVLPSDSELRVQIRTRSAAECRRFIIDTLIQ